MKHEVLYRVFDGQNWQRSEQTLIGHVKSFFTKQEKRLRRWGTSYGNIEDYYVMEYNIVPVKRYSYEHFKALNSIPSFKRRSDWPPHANFIFNDSQGKTLLLVVSPSYKDKVGFEITDPSIVIGIVIGETDPIPGSMFQLASIK